MQRIVFIAGNICSLCACRKCLQCMDKNFRDVVPLCRHVSWNMLLQQRLSGRRRFYDHKDTQFFSADGCMPVGNWLMTMKNPHVYPQVSMVHIIEVVSPKHTEVQTMLVVLGVISKRLCSRRNPFQSVRAQCGKFPRFLAAAPRNLPPVGWQARPVLKFRTQRDWHFPLPFGV